MTNEELIELVQSKTPAELTLDEIGLLKQRLAESAELRSILIDQLQMEHYLHDALGRAGISAEQMLAKADQMQHARTRGIYRLLGLLCLFGLIAICFVWIVIPLFNPDPIADNQLTEESNNTQTNSNTANSQQTSGNNSSTNSQTNQNALAKANSTNSQNSLTEKDPDTKIIAGPWQQQIEQAPLPFDKAWRQDFDPEISSPDQKFIETWFDEYPGSKNRVSTKRIQYRNRVGFAGAYRLKTPLPEGVALRLSFWEQENLAIHCFHENEAVTLVHYRNDYDPWYAYKSKRTNKDTLPKNFRLAANDSYKSRQLKLQYAPTLLIFYDAQEQELVLTRGDVELCRASLPDSPTEIVLQGKVFLRGLELVPISDLPQRKQNWQKIAMQPAPAKLNWEQHLAENVQFQQNDSGSISLSTKSASNGSWIASEIPGKGFRAVDFRLKNVQKGVSVFLTRSQTIEQKGNSQVVAVSPAVGIVFSKNQETGQLYARFAGVYDKGGDTTRSPFSYTSTEIADDVWIRLVSGMGQLRGWISVDSKNWALLPGAIYGIREELSHLGLSITSTSQPLEAELTEVVVRELPLLNSFVSSSVYQQAIKTNPFPDSDYQTWLTLVLESQPEDISQEDWLLANAMKAYLQGSSDQRVLQQFATIALSKQETLENRLQLLHELSIACRSWPGGQSEKQMVKWIAEQHQNLLGEKFSDDQPFNLLNLRQVLFNLPLEHRDTLELISNRILKRELLNLIHQQQWTEVHRYCEEFRFFQRLEEGRFERELPLFAWAQRIAQRESSQLASSNWYGKQTYWRSPLLEELSKETYNISADLNSAIESDAFEDACKIISGVNLYGIEGLAPSPNDRDLLFSLPAAITQAMRQNPRLRDQMNENFSEIAMLRINSAINEGNIEAIRLVSLQFYGTKAAAKANRYLGDRALAIGQVPRAMSYYQQAAVHWEGPLDADTSARIQLAKEMLGDSNEDTIESDVTIGQQSISPNQWSKYISSDTPVRASKKLLNLQASTHTEEFDFLPQGLRADKSINIDLDKGEAPNSMPNEYRMFKTNWVGQQTAITKQADRIILSNRFQVAAIDPVNHRMFWKTQRMGSDRGNAHHWPLQAMHPLILEDQIFTRLLHRNGPRLYCFSLKDGKAIWKVEYATAGPILSDPFLVQGEILVLTGKKDEQNFWNISLSRFDPETGDLIDSSPLTRLRDQWEQRIMCQAVLVKDTIISQFGGIILACDLSGNLRWIREQTYMPVKVHLDWTQQMLCPPLAFDNMVICFQSGVPYIECFSIDTGQLLWSRLIPEAKNAIRLSDSSILLRTENQFLALEAKTGKQIWEQNQVDHILWEIPTKDHLLVAVTQKTNLPVKETTVWLRWLDKKTGIWQSAINLPSFRDSQPQVGPLLFNDNNFWGLYSQGDRGLNLRLVKFATDKNIPVLTTKLNRQEVPLGFNFQASALLDPKPNSQWQIIPGSIEPSLKDQHQAAYEESQKVYLNQLKIESRNPLLLTYPVEKNSDFKQLKIHLLPMKLSSQYQLKVKLGNETILDQMIPEKNQPLPKVVQIPLKKDPQSSENLQILIKAIQLSKEEFLPITKIELVKP